MLFVGSELLFAEIGAVVGHATASESAGANALAAALAGDAVTWSATPLLAGTTTARASTPVPNPADHSDIVDGATNALLARIAGRLPIRWAIGLAERSVRPELAAASPR